MDPTKEATRQGVLFPLTVQTHKERPFVIDIALKVRENQWPFPMRFCGTVSS